SVHVPETDAEPLSGPPYVADVQEATPERLSVPENPTPTAWLYQPFESGARAALAVTVGGVASILVGTFRTQHCGDPLTTTAPVKVTPAVSGETVWSPHPCGLLDPAGSTNDTVTEVRYQSVLHAPIPADVVQLAVIASACATLGSASTASAAAIPTSRVFMAGSPAVPRRPGRIRSARRRPRRPAPPPATPAAGARPRRTAPASRAT